MERERGDSGDKPGAAITWSACTKKNASGPYGSN